MRNLSVLLMALLFAPPLLIAQGADGVFDSQVPADPATPPESKATGTSDGEELTPLVYPNIDVNEILNIYQKMTGKRIIKDVNVQGRISIISPQPVPKEQAIRIIEAALAMNGISLVPMKGEDAIKVIPQGKSPRGEGIPFYADATSLPSGDTMVDYYMPFKYITVNEAMQIFTAYLQGGATPPQIVPVQNTQAVIITDKASNMRKLIEVQKQIDVPPAKVISEFVTLERADAERVVEIITKILDNREQQSGGAPLGPPGAPGATIAGSNISQTEKGLVAGTVKLIPDPRTNRIFVSARPVSFPYIKQLIQEFDKSIKLVPPLEYPLKFIPAGEVLPLLESTLSENKDQQTTSSGNLAPTNVNRPQSSAPRAGGGSADRQLADGMEALAEPNGDTAPQSITIGKTRIIADKKANSILVMGSPEVAEKVKTILKALDKRPQQVYLATVIGELSLTEGDEFGVDFLQRYAGSAKNGAASFSRTTGEGALSVTNGLNPLQVLAAATTGLNVYGKLLGDLNILVKALESNNRFKVISRPVVYTINNRKATISSGRQVAVPTQTLSSFTGDSTPVTQSNIQYKDIVLQLDVVPLINSDKEVTLEILQTANDQAGSTVISGNTIPTISTKVLKTTVTVPSGSTVVLGGLISDRTSRDVTGVPVLSSIPLLGYLFKTTKITTDRSELIIMIQPVVVDNNMETQIASDAELARTQLRPSIERVAKEKPENSVRSGKKKLKDDTEKKNFWE
ncbi:MAG: secretin N-terminal domain-containing protein [Verrucomicrobiota bacterium]|nr:secretin N-terminal domain-containing protein [Verrucomicrobiota bacterium]